MEHFTKTSFEKTMTNSEKPVVVDFWAEWCGPCKMMAPILEELDRERADLVVGKVNVDEEMELSMKYQVVSIPTILLFKNGTLAGKAIGYMPKEELCRALGI